MAGVAAYDPKTSKNTKKTREKYVEDEGQIRKGEMVRGEEEKGKGLKIHHIQIIHIINVYYPLRAKILCPSITNNI